uniref:3-oxo-5-alpha-steroid 4-dehydrogenase C-terminal domain-containing protein n=1 Tax=Setaria viridis TaxID=4556 RepID=A0A4U6UCD6_SETVI|nr:hypothetical protein SEVIR_5G031050v2 [Setaria viridis]
MPLSTTLLIPSCYLFNGVAMIYVQRQRLSRGLSEPAVDLLYPGALVFAVDTAGNFYHHHLLSRLRAAGGGDKGYKIPRGGLFELVACPQYLFEIIGFAMISADDVCARRGRRHGGVPHDARTGTATTATSLLGFASAQGQIK